MNEYDFIMSIDCCFPYEDEGKALSLIKQARDISANASYMVLHEIVRAPRSAGVSFATKQALYEKWLDGFDHHLLPVVRKAAEAMLVDKELSVEEVLELMPQFENEIGQHCALSILYFSCYDQEEKVDDYYNEIIKHWENV